MLLAYKPSAVNDDLLSHHEFVRDGIPHDVFMHYVKKAQHLRQQAFCDALTAMLRRIGVDRSTKVNQGRNDT